MDKGIHIVSLIAPSPPDYGAAFDIFYKIKVLARIGFRIHLHYFGYRGRHHAGLENLCAEIHCYPRKTGLAGLKPFLPYIVSSRIHKDLIKRLNADDHPVILEGIHCTGIIPHLHQERCLMIRLHNDEAVYYDRLMHTEKNLLRKLYFRVEAQLLHQYQHRLPKEVPVAAVSALDQARFARDYSFSRVSFVPVLIPWQQLSCREGTGEYCLYHGNLQVAENEQAALWLIESVFSKRSRPLVIAGRKITERVKRKAAPLPHIRLVESPDDASLEDLIQHAQIHLLPSFNTTGVKLKLLHALWAGRFCVANKACVAGSGLEQEVVIAETPEDYLREVEGLFSTPFTTVHLENRRRSLQRYNNDRNAAQLIEILYSHCR